jgi:hypothetical protein
MRMSHDLQASESAIYTAALLSQDNARRKEFSDR